MLSIGCSNMVWLDVVLYNMLIYNVNINIYTFQHFQVHMEIQSFHFSKIQKASPLLSYESRGLHEIIVWLKHDNHQRLFFYFLSPLQSTRRGNADEPQSRLGHCAIRFLLVPCTCTPLLQAVNNHRTDSDSLFPGLVHVFVSQHLCIHTSYYWTSILPSHYFHLCDNRQSYLLLVL